MSDDFEDWGLEATLSEVRLSLQDWINHGNPEDLNAVPWLCSVGKQNATL